MIPDHNELVCVQDIVSSSHPQRTLLELWFIAPFSALLVSFAHAIKTRGLIGDGHIVYLVWIAADWTLHSLLHISSLTSPPATPLAQVKATAAPVQPARTSRARNGLGSWRGLLFDLFAQIPVGYLQAINARLQPMNDLIFLHPIGDDSFVARTARRRLVLLWNGYPPI